MNRFIAETNIVFYVERANFKTCSVSAPSLSSLNQRAPCLRLAFAPSTKELLANGLLLLCLLSSTSTLLRQEPIL
jgi:hypothetical protein